MADMACCRFYLFLALRTRWNGGGQDGAGRLGQGLAWGKLGRQSWIRQTDFQNKIITAATYVACNPNISLSSRTTEQERPVSELYRQNTNPFPQECNASPKSGLGGYFPISCEER